MSPADRFGRLNKEVRAFIVTKETHKYNLLHSDIPNKDGPSYCHTPKKLTQKLYTLENWTNGSLPHWQWQVVKLYAYHIHLLSWIRWLERTTGATYCTCNEGTRPSKYLPAMHFPFTNQKKNKKHIILGIPRVTCFKLGRNLKSSISTFRLYALLYMRITLNNICSRFSSQSPLI